MSVPVIGRAGADDAAALALIGAATFLESYAHMIGRSDMLAHVQARNSADAFRAFAADARCALWLATLPETRVPVGYALLTPPDLPIPVDYGDVELRRIYILAKWQGGGLGGKLAGAAIDHARAAGKRRLLIGVFSGNARAIGFYRRIGGVEIGRRRFQVGEALFDDLIFGLDL